MLRCSPGSSVVEVRVTLKDADVSCFSWVRPRARSSNSNSEGFGVSSMGRVCAAFADNPAVFPSLTQSSFREQGVPERWVFRPFKWSVRHMGTSFRIERLMGFESTQSETTS